VRGASHAVAKRWRRKAPPQAEDGQRRGHRLKPVLLLFGEEHVAGREIAAAAVVEVEDEVIF
jgi:hypothetical protein